MPFTIPFIPGHAWRHSGVVTRRTGVFPQLTSVVYNCGACGVAIGPFKITEQGEKLVRPTSCPSCQAPGECSELRDCSECIDVMGH